MIIKTLTIMQPWATLLVHGFKKFETRPKSVNFKYYKGLFAIHAGKSLLGLQTIQGIRVEDNKKPFIHCLAKCAGDDYRYYTGAPEDSDVPGCVFRGKDNPGPLPFGAVLGIAEIIACYKTKNIVEHINRQEILFGDFTPGRLAFLCSQRLKFRNPIPADGKQGLWHWTPTEEAVEQIKADTYISKKLKL